METDLSGRVVLVTGASGGIGGEVVRAFVREGARVVAHFGEHGDRAQALANELGPACVPLGADLTLEAEVERLFAEIEVGLGPVEVLVANAGLWPADDVPLERMTLKQWHATLDANLTSVFLCAREFFRGIIRHGLIDPAAVLVGSTAALFGEAGHADYAAAKAAVTYGLARSLKNEIARLAPRGRVNVVCPGWTFTPMTQALADDPERVRRVLQTVPLRKVGRPADVAMAVLYLASSRLAGHVSGQILTVAGGMEGRVLYEKDEIDPDKA
ncbi:MAG TPA: SDR family oxidoreductase [Gemmataceae bacterium]|nr:SDR family oxidoreductase [Gemmataceae bacterium]